MRALKIILATIILLNCVTWVKAQSDSLLINKTNIGNESKAVFRSVEQEASYKEGKAALIKFLEKELHYPEIMLEKGYGGIVELTFIVNTDGGIDSVIVTQSAGKLFDKEAVRVVKNMPAWSPAKVNGKPVNSYYALPIIFQLMDEKMVFDKKNSKSYIIQNVYADVHASPNNIDLDSFIAQHHEAYKFKKQVALDLDIDEKGIAKITNCKASVPGQEEELCKEATRLFQFLPAFSPALIDGKAIKSDIRIVLVL